MMSRTLTQQDVEDVFFYDRDPDLDQKPEPYTRDEREMHARGMALRPLVTLHISDRAIIGHAADNEHADEIAAKSDSPIISRRSGYIASSEARRWVGLSWK